MERILHSFLHSFFAFIDVIASWLTGLLACLQSLKIFSQGLLAISIPCIRCFATQDCSLEKTSCLPVHFADGHALIVSSSSESNRHLAEPAEPV